MPPMICECDDGFESQLKYVLHKSTVQRWNLAGCWTHSWFKSLGLLVRRMICVVELDGIRVFQELCQNLAVRIPTLEYFYGVRREANGNTGKHELERPSLCLEQRFKSMCVRSMFRYRQKSDFVLAKRNSSHLRCHARASILQRKVNTSTRFTTHAQLPGIRIATITLLFIHVVDINPVPELPRQAAM
ncbi:hypothetical protein BU23DRAFT_293331 [Bimuria novae-zelandiae CBS 107.79]|uniref:Uncharacterized protein n=1 Tax=Bimuria novae-zelandiae CBS 107.79 TaxID=1447943 RepID=A0A6A5UR03_9PLEO|nr:hypothetical protein BU23DRAFT_293331 [Bimuria novae-zelandiae CBS 107.79]